MPKFLVMWEADETKIPVDPNLRREGWLGAIAMTKEEIKSGLAKDWGCFLGEPRGFTLEEGTEEQVMASALKYIPFFRFKVIPIMSIDDVEKAIKQIK